MIIKHINFSKSYINRLLNLAICPVCNVVVEKTVKFPLCSSCFYKENKGLIVEIRKRIIAKAITKEQGEAEFNLRATRNEKLTEYALQDGDIIYGNFSQSKPHKDMAPYFKGKKITLKEYNCTNGDYPDNVTLDREGSRGHLHFHKIRCSNKHPKLLAKGEIDECENSPNCKHVQKTDTVKLNGKIVFTKYYYRNEVVD